MISKKVRPAPGEGSGTASWLNGLVLMIVSVPEFSPLAVRLYSRQGKDLTERFPMIVEAMERLPSCTFDGEAIACDDSGVASFNLLLHRKRDDRVFLYAFDLIELDGEDLRREPLEQRKIELRRLLADTATALVFNEWIDGEEFDGATVLSTRGPLVLKASCRSARTCATSRGDRRTGLKRRTRTARPRAAKRKRTGRDSCRRPATATSCLPN